MQKPTNGAPEIRWHGAIPLLAEPSLVCHDRATFTDRMLAEAVAYQVENLDDGDLEPGEDPTPDAELDDRIEELREAKECSALIAFLVATELRAFLLLAGYADDDELPRYQPRRHNRGA
jgi:hypothetical protein